MHRSISVEIVVAVLLLFTAAAYSVSAATSTIQTLSSLPNSLVPFKYKSVSVSHIKMLSDKDQSFLYYGWYNLYLCNPTTGTIQSLFSQYDLTSFDVDRTNGVVYYSVLFSAIYAYNLKTGIHTRIAGGGNDNSDDIPAKYAALSRVSSVSYDSNQYSLPQSAI